MVIDSRACLDVILDTDRGRLLHRPPLDPEPALLVPATAWVEGGRVLRAEDGDCAFVALAEATAQPLPTTDLPSRGPRASTVASRCCTHLDDG